MFTDSLDFTAEKKQTIYEGLVSKYDSFVNDMKYNNRFGQAISISLGANERERMLDLISCRVENDIFNDSKQQIEIVVKSCRILIKQFVARDYGNTVDGKDISDYIDKNLI